jgi:hypothetical protein
MRLTLSAASGFFELSAALQIQLVHMCCMKETVVHLRTRTRRTIVGVPVDPPEGAQALTGMHRFIAASIQAP